MAKSREQLLEHYRRNRTGHRMGDLDGFLRAWGFVSKEGGKHLLYFHPDHPGITQTVTRGSGEMDPGYFRSAVERIDELKRREKGADNGSNESGS